MTTRMVELSAGALELLELPGESDDMLVLLHQGLGSAGLWRDFPQRLNEATGANVIAFSRYGHGSSDPPPKPRTPTFMHEEALEVLPELLHELHRDDDPILIGHSDGASIALIYAAHHQPRATVAIAPHVFVEEVCLAEIRAVKHTYETTDLRERMARHHHDPDAAFYGWNDVWLHPDFPKWDIRDELDKIDCPLLLIQGTQDQYGTLAQLDAIERHVPGPTTRVELDCRHDPPLERPDETVDAIASWLRS